MSGVGCGWRREITQPYVHKATWFCWGGPSDPQLLVASVRITLFIEETFPS